MRITDEVDIPNELIESATNGSLVLFVGAGASINKPSRLPLFDALAAFVAELNGVELDRRVNADVFLGRLDESHPFVREQVRDRISEPTSQPNDIHRGIVRLASATNTFRVVTTNYDEHLTTAATELGIDVGEVFNGPAVPLGHDFSGIVHLHGAISRSPSQLVLTDGDFGRAYLTDGWARRFVQDLFLSHTVLFVGYSHNDEVMKYLARGLPPATKRFALTDMPDDPKWSDLRISPVEYSGENDHFELTDVLHKWADRLSMGQLDHRARVSEIVKGAPPKLPSEADYIAFAITTPAGVRAFAEGATGPNWLRWAEGQEVFRSLFSMTGSASDESAVLAAWFASKYVANIDLNKFALETLARNGPIVRDELMRELVWNARKLADSNPKASLKWSTVATSALQTHTGNPEESALILHGTSIGGTTAMPFLRRAIRPRLVLGERNR